MPMYPRGSYKLNGQNFWLIPETDDQHLERIPNLYYNKTILEQLNCEVRPTPVS